MRLEARPGHGALLPAGVKYIMLTPDPLGEPETPRRSEIAGAQLFPRLGVLCNRPVQLLVVVPLEQKVVVPRALAPAQRLGGRDLTMAQTTPHGHLVLKVAVSRAEVLLILFPAWACMWRDAAWRARMRREEGAMWENEGLARALQLRCGGR